jgi:hypothetical protein
MAVSIVWLKLFKIFIRNEFAGQAIKRRISPGIGNMTELERRKELYRDKFRQRFYKILA